MNVFVVEVVGLTIFFRRVCMCVVRNLIIFCFSLSFTLTKLKRKVGDTRMIHSFCDLCFFFSSVDINILRYYC